MKSDSAIGQHLITNPECAKAYTDDSFRIIGQARSSFHLGVLESVYIKTQNPVLCKQKEFVFHLDSSSKQWWIGANWPIIGPNRRIIHHITCTRIWLYISFHLSVAIRRFILWRVSDEKSFQYAKAMFPLFRAIVKFCSTNRLFTSPFIHILSPWDSHNELLSFSVLLFISVNTGQLARTNWPGANVSTVGMRTVTSTHSYISAKITEVNCHSTEKGQLSEQNS